MTTESRQQRIEATLPRRSKRQRHPPQSTKIKGLRRHNRGCKNIGRTRVPTPNSARQSPIARKEDVFRHLVEKKSHAREEPEQGKMEKPSPPKPTATSTAADQGNTSAMLGKTMPSNAKVYLAPPKEEKSVHEIICIVEAKEVARDAAGSSRPATKLGKNITTYKTTLAPIHPSRQPCDPTCRMDLQCPRPPKPKSPLRKPSRWSPSPRRLPARQSSRRTEIATMA